MSGLLSDILGAHPELNVVEKELVKGLCKLLVFVNEDEAEVTRAWRDSLSQARLLANTLGLIRKGVFEEEGADLATMLQSAGDDGTGGA